MFRSLLRRMAAAPARMAPRAVILAMLAGIATAAPAESATVPASSGSYANDPGHTRFLWRIEHLGLSNYTARINGVSIELEFDAEDMTASSVKAVIDPRTVDTGYEGEEDFNAKIANDERILNAGKYPSIEFVSTRIAMTGTNTLDVEGDLTLLGVTRPVTLAVTLSGSTAKHPFAGVPALGFAATTVVDRTEFGLDFLSGSGLGDAIEIEIQTEFIKR